MSYPQITEYLEAVQHPAHSFIDPDLKRGTVAENNLGLPLVMSGGFALTYAVATPRRKCAVRCFHREIPAIQQKYEAISKKLRSLANGCFVDFDFQQRGISVRQRIFPIVRMDWVEGDTLGVWLDKHFDDPCALEKARRDFISIAQFLERQGIAHGDIQNGNVMVTNGEIRLIDYDGMFVPGMHPEMASETGHKHFQHPSRGVANFGPAMDRFSFIALDLSLQAVIEDKSLYRKFREGGETIIFKANDFADPPNSEIFRRLLVMPKLKQKAWNFIAICDAPLAAVPTIDDFLAGRNIPAAKTAIKTSPAPEPKPRAAAYIPAYPVVDALNFSAALKRVGDRVELIGRIVEVKPGSQRRAKGQAKRYVFINFGSGRGNIVRISIWSDGLAKLKEQPSNAWIGRWVSVTGLMEVLYENKRHGHKHLSITVQEDGQIQQLDEAQAGFRLTSISAVLPPCDGDAAAAAVLGAGMAAPPPAVAKPKSLSSHKRKTARNVKRTGRNQATPAAFAAAPAQQTARSSTRFFGRKQRWIYAIAAIVVLVVSIALLGIS